MDYKKLNAIIYAVLAALFKRPQKKESKRPKYLLLRAMKYLMRARLYLQKAQCLMVLRLILYLPALP